MTKALQYILITITLTLGLASVSAAEKNNFQAPDFQAIKTETLNPDSKYYYPKLIAKFHSNDTTMTLDEYRHLSTDTCSKRTTTHTANQFTPLR